jgi:hypothetical protein
MPKPPAAIPETRQPRAGETEKMAVNMGVVDLGQVDLPRPGGLLLESV